MAACFPCSKNRSSIGFLISKSVSRRTTDSNSSSSQALNFVNTSRNLQEKTTSNLQRCLSNLLFLLPIQQFIDDFPALLMSEKLLLTFCKHLNSGLVNKGKAWISCVSILSVEHAFRGTFVHLTYVPTKYVLKILMIRWHIGYSQRNKTSKTQ